MYQIDYNSYRSVKGYSRRVRFLVMHYTAVDFATSARLLSGDGGASAHYLVPDPTDQTYIDAGFNDLRIFNLVDESERAWHAGVSSWAGRSNLNDTAIGIEIVNLASDETGEFVFPPFNEEQIAAVKQLALNIVQRYPDMTPVNSSSRACWAWASCGTLFCRTASCGRRKTPLKRGVKCTATCCA